MKCIDCKHWKYDNEKILDGGDMFGECEHPNIIDLGGQEKQADTMAGYDRFFITKPAFGCVLFDTGVEETEKQKLNRRTT